MGLFPRLTAQNSFVWRYSNTIYYSRDVIQDSKGCFVGSFNDIVRISPYGKELWSRSGSGMRGASYLAEFDKRLYVIGEGMDVLGSTQLGSYDLHGNTIFDSVGYRFDSMYYINYFYLDTARQQIIASGNFYRNVTNYKTKVWVAGFSLDGRLLWQNTIGEKDKSMGGSKIFKTAMGYLILAGVEIDNYLMVVDTLGKFISRKPIEPNPYPGSDSYGYRFLDLVAYTKTSFVAPVFLSGIGIPNAKSGGYFFVYDSVGNKIGQKFLFSIFFDSFLGYIHINPTADGGLIGGGGISLTKYNKELDIEWTKRVVSDSLEITKVAQSSDGGFYGIGIERHSFPGFEINVVIFKTDSLGNIKPSANNTEKEKPLMLQPNPAHGSVRVAIPYYYGLVEVSLYDLQGRFLWSKTTDNLQTIDISSLTTGVYMVKGRIPETGEVRNMKLVVE